MSVVFALGMAVLSGIITYMLVHSRAEDRLARQAQVLADARAALDSERRVFEQTAKAIEENTKRRALEEFLADVRIEERHYVRQHRVLFAYRKSLVLEERIFFRNIPLSNWVEHEVQVEEGADLDHVARTFSVFNGVLNETEDAPPEIARRLLFGEL